MDNGQRAIACSLVRGGTSRGVYFLAADLPGDRRQRDRVLQAVLGGPDSLQIDGVGGGHPLTSKVAIVKPSLRRDADVDYLFLQVAPDHAFVSDTQNCGNILAGIGPFAIESGLVSAAEDETRIRVHMENSGNVCELILQTPGGVIAVAGSTSIDGVPGTSAAIRCNYLDIAGSVSGSLLPTGRLLDSIAGVEATLIDNGMPVVLVRAQELGCTGYESPHDLDADETLKSRVEHLRQKAGPMMNLGDIRNKTVPKMCLLAEARGAGHISTRTFIPHACHRSIGVLGAVTVASACVLPGTLAHDIAKRETGSARSIRVEHPSGSFEVRLQLDEQAQPEQMIRQAGVVRTARTLMRGQAFVPSHVWDEHG